MKHAATVKSIIEKHVKGLQLTEEKFNIPLTDLGIDSLDVMMVLMDISEVSGVEIPDDLVDDLNTPMKLTEFLEAS